jgi:two-component system chemotaxis response regulator CheY
MATPPPEIVRAAREAREAMMPASAVRVMIVDDESIMRTLTRRMLERMGFTEIYSAKNGAEALPLALSQRPDLIIADYDMPTMHGLQFLKAIRQDPELEKTRFILLSGVANREVVQKAMELGADACVAKPIAPAELARRIDDVLRRQTGTGIALRPAA